MRLLYLVSHPIQYQAPLLRLIADAPNVELQVLFENKKSSVAYFDSGFEREITWSTNLIDGYENHQVSKLSEIRSYLSETDVFWLHGWNTYLKLKALNLAWRSNIPVLMRGENTLSAMPDGEMLRGFIKRSYLEWIFRRCSVFLYIGSDNREYYSFHGIKDSRLCFMPYAVDNAFFRTASHREDFNPRDILGLEKDRPIILFVGKFLKRKNPDLLIDACRLMDRHMTRNPYLVFVGSGGQERRLREMASNLDWIKFLGFHNQSELPAIYSMADVFVMPSQAEPWGLAVNEAMAAGTAVISTTDCGCSTDLIDNTVGRSVPANDGPALARAIEEVLVDAERCLAMGQAARKRVAAWSFTEDLVGLNRALKIVSELPNLT